MRRIVVTSSCVAILAASEVPVTVSEATWNDGCIAECEEKGNDASPLAKYSASKTWAEKGVFDIFFYGRGYDPDRKNNFAIDSRLGLL